MRSFGRAAAVACTLAILPPVLLAQTSQPQRLYNEALEREAALRKELDALSPGAADPILERVRILVTSYEDMSRLFPESGYSDNALWQGARLSAAAYWQFGHDEDRQTALQMLKDLAARFPSSSLIKQIPAETRRLATPTTASRPAAAPAVSPASARDTAPHSAGPRAGSAGVPASRAGASPAASPAPRESARPAATSPPASRPPAEAGPAAALRSIRREVLPDAVRITLELDREVPFYHEQLQAPPRVFVDLRNTAAVRSLRGATIPFPDDVVSQVRIGLHLDGRTRVVLDLAGLRKYSVYALYSPFRVVVDVERGTPSASRAARGSATAPAQPPSRTNAAPPLAASANTGGGFSLSRQLGLGVARVAIDPGHGGQDPGARTNELTEAALVLDVALRLEKLLLKEPGVEVVLTRRTDTYVPLEERTALANRARADLFLSIHANASRNDDARGVETYFLNFAANPEAEAIAARENADSSGTMRELPDIVKAIALNNKIDESRDFASIVQSTLYERLRKVHRRARNLGVKQAPFVVLIGATMPSVLAEISFLTNGEEAGLLRTEAYRQHIAEALFAGVMAYQQSLKKSTAVATN